MAHCRRSERGPGQNRDCRCDRRPRSPSLGARRASHPCENALLLKRGRLETRRCPDELRQRVLRRTLAVLFVDDASHGSNLGPLPMTAEASDVCGKLCACLVDARPYRIDGYILQARDLLAAVAIDLEEDEGRTLGFGELRQET